MSKKISNNQIIILSIIAAIFFFIYSFLIFGNTGAKFTWPDETANYFFIKNYIEHSNFSVAEPLNEIGGNLIKPRSFNIYQGNLVPGSFLGMLLIYGLIGKLVGIGLVKFLTPLLAALAGLFFYKILLKIFEPKIALISALLFYINPAWWYYSSLTFLPNISFITLILIGIYFLLKIDQAKKQPNWLLVISGGFFISLALIIRTNEFLWILASLAFVAFFYRQKIKWQHVILFLAVLFIVFMPILYYNHITYGQALSFGYLRLANGQNLTEQLPTEFKNSQLGALNLVKFIFLPFGLHPRNILTNFYHYYFLLFWWLFLGLAGGGFLFLKDYHEKKHGIYFLLALCVSLYLLAYYGSWDFTDQMTLALNKIGVSYVRYFLPIYILSLPLAAIFLAALINLFSKKKSKIFIGLIFIAVYLGFAINVVYLEANDNLVKVKNDINSYNKINKEVLAGIEENAVIISQRSDKIFFPEHKVISQWQYEDLETWYNLLNASIPLYYYAYEDAIYLDDLSYNLEDFDMFLSEGTPVNETETLYKIELANYDEEY